MAESLILNLDGTVITNQDELHNTIAWQLNLPDYYGRNLDALWDILSTWSKPLRIEVAETYKLQNHLGDYANLLLDLLRDAASENDVIALNIAGK